MKTKVVRLSEKNLDESAIKEAGEIIKSGGLVAFPTETVYGLGANALDPEAVTKIFIAKGRPQDNPLIIHVADYDIDSYVKNVPGVAREIIKKFWPGPITIILEKTDLIPDETSANLSTVGIRMPENNIARSLIKAAGVPIAAPSANISGKPSPTDMESCIEDLNGKIDCILGGENSVVGMESTIVDCTTTPTCILRPGAITLEMLKEIDSGTYIDKSILSKPKEDFKPKAPGMKYRHYAPKSPVKIVQGDINKVIAKINQMVLNYSKQGKRVGIIATDETKGLYKNATIVSLGARSCMDDVGKNLFRVLRGFDALDIDIILCEAFEEVGVGMAIMNRLKKSAGFDILEI
ncbi:MAG: L-threonylcarbamoyladenylate synthase [Clostridium sp.]|uniref:L-threonylcarbamoyladenylate synthase n=1 Tax=Clostridium sp. TaxID=1506 RepID=UPI0030424C94